MGEREAGGKHSRTRANGRQHLRADPRLDAECSLSQMGTRYSFCDPIDPPLSNKSGREILDTIGVKSQATVHQALLDLSKISCTGSTKKHEADVIAALLYLFDSGADVNTVDEKGNSALHCASLSGNTAVVKSLCGRDVNILAKNHMGLAALHIAALQDHNSGTLICLLLDNGAQIEQRTHGTEYTALSLAVE